MWFLNLVQQVLAPPFAELSPLCLLASKPAVSMTSKPGRMRPFNSGPNTNAFAQSLPYPDAQFDVVLTTIMLHHLTKKGRGELVGEIRRVLKPGGRVLAIDFGRTARERKSFLDHFHHRHGQVEFDEIISLLNSAGLNVAENGAVGMLDLEFVLAKLPVAHEP